MRSFILGLALLYLTSSAFATERPIQQKVQKPSSFELVPECKIADNICYFVNTKPNPIVCSLFAKGETNDGEIRTKGYSTEISPGDYALVHVSGWLKKLTGTAKCEFKSSWPPDRATRDALLKTVEKEIEGWDELDRDILYMDLASKTLEQLLEKYPMLPKEKLKYMKDRR